MVCAGLCQLVRFPTEVIYEPAAAADRFQQSRYLLFIYNICALCVLTIFTLPQLDAPFLKASFKLLIPFFATYCFV